MSMNNANYLRSPCEVIREINDMFQGDSEKEKKVRELLAEAESKTKRMSIELSKYDKTYHKGWWERIKDFEKRMKQRTHPDYKFKKV